MRQAPSRLCRSIISVGACALCVGIYDLAKLHKTQNRLCFEILKSRVLTQSRLSTQTEIDNPYMTPL